MINLSINTTPGFVPPIQYMSIFDILFQCWGWLGMILFFPANICKFLMLHEDHRVWKGERLGAGYHVPSLSLCSIHTLDDRTARNLGASKNGGELKWLTL
jgi:hypothetical protein